VAVGACAEAENNCCSDIKSEGNKAQEESYVEVRDAEFSVLGVGGGGGEEEEARIIGERVGGWTAVFSGRRW
jgi:hypothetical protein